MALGPPIKTACRDNLLVLFEYYIKWVHCETMAEHNDKFFAPTAVYVELFHYTKWQPPTGRPLAIFKRDTRFRLKASAPKARDDFYHGQSILFALSPKLMSDKRTLHRIYFKLVKEIYQTKTFELPFTYKVVGMADVDFSYEYNSTRRAISGYNKVYNDKRYRIGKDGSYIFDGVVPLIRHGKKGGEMHVYTRIKHFDQTIITAFDGFEPGLCQKNFRFQAESKQFEKSKLEWDLSAVYDDEEDEEIFGPCPICRLCNNNPLKEYPCLGCEHVLRKKRRTLRYLDQPKVPNQSSAESESAEESEDMITMAKPFQSSSDSLSTSH